MKLEMILRSLFNACRNVCSINVNYKDCLQRNAGMSNQEYLKGLTIPHGSTSNFTEEVIEHVLTLASDANLTVRQLAVAGLTPYCLRAGLWEMPRDAEILSKYYKLFQHVQSLYLVFSGTEYTTDKLDVSPWLYFDFRKTMSIFGDGGLVKWLQHCPELRHLRVTMPITPEPGLKAQLQHILGSVHMSSLVSLHLTHFRNRPKDLTDALLRHSITFMDLTLADIHIEYDDWRSCLSAIAGQLPCLEWVRFTSPLSFEPGGPDDFEWVMSRDLQSSEEVDATEAELARYVLEGGSLSV
ncbi:hypothetical protein Slin15195_G062510 [Septoria linicola]|uniref:Uncharacterized protein n=1 Tax=Septoria linicola TaxID=215465 RepID=A0A9Q9AVX3_9PEZI|nr:hypothetical protein Slin14017_G112840 [Septoria linicola]USW52932.1 hypothetical protein Slin15195_G062510 [Septoria linicola]